MSMKYLIDYRVSNQGWQLFPAANQSQAEAIYLSVCARMTHSIDRVVLYLVEGSTMSKMRCARWYPGFNVNHLW